MERKSHQTVWTCMVKISQAQTPQWNQFREGFLFQEWIQSSDDNEICGLGIFGGLHIRRPNEFFWIFDFCPDHSIILFPSLEIQSTPHPRLFSCLSVVLCSLRKQPAFCYVTTGFHSKWRLRNNRINSVLMMFHYPDLGGTSDWSCHKGNSFFSS